MKLREGAHYRPLLDGLEGKTIHIQDLVALDVPVDVLADFQALRDESGMQAIGATPALYRRSCQTIFINESKFAALDTSVQSAILMHEVGHSYRHARDIDKLSMGEECIEADLLACRWGFGEALIEMRRSDYGDGYARRLADHANDEEAARVALKEWRFRRLMGF